jgi:hypothetical protein
MKKITFTLFALTVSIISYCQTKVEVDFSEIDPNGELKGTAYEFKEGDAPDFQIIFKNVDVAAKTAIEGYKFFLKETEKQQRAFINENNYNSTNRTYTLDLSTMLSNDIDESLTPFTIKIGNKAIYKVDIKYVKKEEPTKTTTTLTKTQVQLAIDNYFSRQLLPNLKKKIGLKETKLAYVDNKNIIHLFIDMYGKFYGPGIPTAATEKNRFQFHILLTEEQAEEYSFETLYTGEYNFQILNVLDTRSSGKPQSDKGNTLEIKPWNGAVKGPYTDLFSVEITRNKREGKESKKIVDAEIKIAKLYHVSISTGLLATTLRNPQNIETMELANGDTTLIADDPSIRGVLTIMATFYPKGRSFLFPPEGGVFDISRIGIQVGTRIDKDIAENFFLGLSHDFARGGAISYGAHYGRRNYVAGNRDFNFGSDKFDLPELIIKKEWNVGFYFGVVIDTRVALELFKSLGNTQ